ncbi:MAG: 4-(cytidine 5'-diphospho)-2-C-methyl-D-erythritol kinase [Firmicutes bacterium]|nr:4-(cytidine 5'-diphospho)-2-C-methyl-D-erythritol kinase [Bacillota bacterium]
MKEFVLPSYAKINLSLHVVDKRDNMHELDMVNATISLCDEIKISFNDSDEINITFSERSIDEKNNTVLKACQLVQEQFKFGANIFIQKNIPTEAGLGGGSGNAATVLSALEKQFNLLSYGIDIFKIAKKIGSDVPSMLTTGYKRVQRTGEIVEKINSNLPLNLLLVKGKKGVSTRECFERLGVNEIASVALCHSENNPDDNSSHSSYASLISAIQENNIPLLIHSLTNDLTAPAISLVPEIADHLAILKKYGALISFMTGSGSCCVGIFKTQYLARQAEVEIKKTGLWTAVCITL